MYFFYEKKDQLLDILANSNLYLLLSVRSRGRESGCSLTGWYWLFINFEKVAVDCCRLLNVEESKIAVGRNVS